MEAIISKVAKGLRRRMSNCLCRDGDDSTSNRRTKEYGKTHQGNGETINLLPRRVLPPETFCFAASPRQHSTVVEQRCVGAPVRIFDAKP